MEDAYETVEMNESRRANAYFMLHNYSGKLRRESSLVSVNGFFVDVDTKHGNVKDYAELESRLAFLGLVPHYVVSTAGGWHVHFLTEPIPYRKNVRFVKNLQTYLTEFL